MSLKKKDYENNNGMLTTVWGPSLWHSIHTMSFNYPVKPTKPNKLIIINLSCRWKRSYLVNTVVKIFLKTWTP